MVALMHAPDGWAPWEDWSKGFSDYARTPEGVVARFSRPERAVSMTCELDQWDGQLPLLLEWDVMWGGDWPKTNKVAGPSGIKFPMPGVAYIENKTGLGGELGTARNPGASIR